MLRLLNRFTYMLLLVCTGWLGGMPSYAADLSGRGKIAAGGGHSCVLTTAGGVKRWGNNGNAQLGDNSTTNRLIPVNAP
jgi:hypothetical protein